MSIDAISLKFKSGNDVPVESARITREDWDSVLQEINRLRNALEEAHEALDMSLPVRAKYVIQCAITWTH